VDGRGHQHARLRYRFKRSADIGRIERLPVAEGQAALQGQQHCHLKAVHVLRGHRPDQRVGAPISQPEAVGRRLHGADQRAPCLAMRHGRPCRAGSEQVGHDLRGVDLRDLDGSVGRLRQRRIAQARQIDGAVRSVVQAEHIGCEGRQLAHHLGRLHGRQQADLARDQRRTQADGKTVAVGAGVEDVTTRREHCGQLRHIDQERAHGNRRAISPGDGLVQRRMGYQRVTRHRVNTRHGKPSVWQRCQAARSAVHRAWSARACVD
jgi:hypothetical protein